jgi:CheY-like chemotaxis protein
MEGTVSFQSSTEKGSRFWLDLRLPADELNPFAVPPAIEPVLDLNPFSAALSGARNEIALTTLKGNGHQPTSSFTLLRVLVVDDSEVNRFILCELLATLGIKATMARNGEEAVAAFSRSALDIILMDIQMPVMDGVAATAAIQRLQAEQNMNPDCIVVGVSAHAMSGDREKYLASGMADYLTKPIDRKNLESCLSALAKELRGDIHLWR